MSSDGARLIFLYLIVSASIFSSLEIQDFFIIPGNRTFRCSLSFPGGSDGKVSAYNVEDQGSTPGSGRSPGEGNGNALQYSCLENPTDGGTC